ncbi:TonB-dependent receptor [Neolewinella aurantiaca]|uniref:TonB-dependent receptor n=1 Tax=Neolewinella aurantiaca TaxID=2602767 RepID=A0A5C7FVK3_9BACT|nr:TonB-dependent receptor [Neolewinella aurantiaca]TXF90375.1 TonB-dependent receptor [Neolewinella aurantiaca]
MILRTKLMLVGLLFLNISLFAQDTRVLTGTVSDADDFTLIGVNILVTGTSRGTSTDFDGNYELEVSTGDVLQFSYTGYVSQTITVGNQTELNVTLAGDAAVLEEVVVVGYGSRKKSDITGAVSSVKSEELNAFPVLDAAQALQGRAAGVVVQSNNGGEPGAPINIKIRGNTSISANSSPLIVVDGFVGATMPQANDIASMEVLKDASATAIYGSRGSNGVILVTTKKGKSGRLSIELNSTYATQNTANELDLLNADEFADYQNQIRANNGISTPYPQGPADTDWQDLIYQSGNTQNHQLSLSGGSDKVNFYASGNFFDQQGIVVNSGFERATFLSNIDAQVNDKFKLGLNLFGSRGTKDGVTTQSDGSVTVGGDDVISLAMRFAPDKPVQDEDGNFTTNDVIGDEVDNPFAVATQRVDETVTDNFRANVYANYDILKNLSFKTTFGLSSENVSRGVYQPSSLQITASAVGGRASVVNTKRTSVLSENYLTYTKEIGKGALTLLGGYSYQKNKNEAFAAAGTGFLSDAFSYYALSTATGLLQPASSLSETEIQSQFGRLNYDYDNRYLVTATVRRDGASNFAANNKYAVFPSAALGWKISNEDFLIDNETISSLKLRVSYGVTGNPSISPYQSLARFASLYASRNGQTVFAITPDQPANPDLKWESSYQTNIGVDLGLIDNRVNLSVDYYNIDTKDLILGNNGIPEYFGFQNDEILTNLGEINNRGFEISLNTKNIVKGDFRWSTDFNLSANKNEVAALINDADLFGNAAPSYFSHDRSYVLRVGEEVGLFWGYEYSGVYQGGDLPAGTQTLTGGVAGDPLFVDTDGNGEITEADRTIIGNPNPDFTFGFTNNFTYKNFDLNIFFQGAQGGDIFNMTNVQLNNGDANTTRDYFNNAWTPTNTDTDQPRVGNNSNREISSRFVEDGSYIRLKNIALGYNLPTATVEKLGIGGIRLSVSAQNLLTITDYSGLDPEVNYFGASGDNNTSSNTVQGFDFGNYPTVKSFNFSLNVQF